MKTNDIILIKSVPLKSVDYHSCLTSVIKVGEAEDNSTIILGLSGDKTDRLKSREGSKDMGDFSLSCSIRNSFYVDSVRSILRDRQGRVKFVDKTDHIVGEARSTASTATDSGEEIDKILATSGVKVGG